MEYSLQALGSVIREWRLAEDMTQEALGQSADYGAGGAVSISRIEAGLTRPRADRLAGIAVALHHTPGQLESTAAARTSEDDKPGGSQTGGDARQIKERVRQIQEEIDRRTGLITELGDAFNAAHDRARDDFFMRFVEIARNVDGAPQPDPEALEADEGADAEAAAALRLRVTSYGIAHVLTGGVGGAAAGAAVGGAAAYGTFLAAVSLGTASTGAAISGLSGVAATNAALALLGGGTLAAGGAGMAGGTLLLTSIVAAPALLLAFGGVVWMVKRSRKQREELARKLDEADENIAATSRGFEALVDILPRCTEVLDYISLHAGHALSKWEAKLGPLPLAWASLSPDDRSNYEAFIEIAASQLSLVTINVQDMLVSRGKEREHLIEVADEVLSQSRAVVSMRV